MLTIVFLGLLFVVGGPAGQSGCEAEVEEMQSASRAYEARFDPGEPAEWLLDVSRRVRTCKAVGSAAWVDALIHEADVLVRRGQRPAAIELTSAFIEGEMSTAAADDQARVWLHRGIQYVHLDRLLEAVRDLLAARALVSADHLESRFEIHSELGSAYRLLGAHEDAIAAFRELIGIAQALDEPENLAFAHARHAEAIADHWSRGSRRDRARILGAVSEAETAARVINQRVSELGSSAPAHVLYRRTETNMTWYRALSFAGLHDQALEVALTIPSMLAAEYVTDETMGLLAVGAALERAGRLEEAYTVLRRAASNPRIEPLFGPPVRRLLGGVLMSLGRLDEAEAELLAAVEAHEASTGELGASQWASLNFNFAQPALRSLIALYLMQERPEEAFEVLERSRARSVRSARRLVESMDPAIGQSDVEELREELRRVRRQMLHSGGTGALGRRASELEAEIASFEARTRADNTVDLASVQAGLSSEGRVIVTYFLQEERPSYAFVLRSDTLAAVQLPLRLSELWAVVEQSRIGMETGDAFELDPVALHALYSAVFAPVAHLLAPGVPITIIPEGPLLEVPFAMLIDEPGDRYQYHDWSYLVYRHAFSYDLAASLGSSSRDTSPKLPIVAYGRSSFDASDVIRGLVETVPPLLPGVRDEIAALRRILPRGRYKIDEDATRAAFLTDLPFGRIVHVASHVYLSPTRPMYSAILLSPDAGGEDGALYLHEIVGRSLSAELVVVSACESGAGELRQGEGLVGLHYAFRSAGAGATVATLWPVDDRAMTQLMGRFYRELARGLPKDVALQRAQIGFLQGKERLAANPFLWAGVMLSGDPSPISDAPRRYSPLSWMLVGVTLLVAAFLIARRANRIHP